MGQTVFTDTVCDRCHHLERTDEAMDMNELPTGWAFIEETPFVRSARATVNFEAGHVTEYIVCPDCSAAFKIWMESNRVEN